MKSLLAVAAVAATIATTPAHAAKIWTESGFCLDQKGSCRIIHIEGKIEPNDWKIFKGIAYQANTPTVVQLNSGGGSLEGGLIIGVGVQTLGFSTYVPADAGCASVCAAIWLAGKARYAATTAGIGFHQPYATDGRGRIYRSEGATNIMKAYYAKIGISKPAADFFLAADPKDVYWLNSDLAKGFDIEYTSISPKPVAAPSTKPVAASDTKPAGGRAPSGFESQWEGGE